MDEAQTGIKIAGSNINNHRYVDDITLMAESEEELKIVKEQSEKIGLKLNSQETKIMSSGLNNLWQTDRETVTDFMLLGSKITADGDCSHEIKKTLAPWKKTMTKLDSILESRDIILLTNVNLVKAMVFLVVI